MPQIYYTQSKQFTVSINMFNTTGQVHFSGIKNEHETIKLLNEWAIYPDTKLLTWEEQNRRKMLKQVSRASALSTKKGLNSGSLIGLILPKLFLLIADDHFDTFNTWVRVIRNSKTDLQQNSIDVVRDEFNKVCNLGLKYIRQADLQAFVINSLFNDLDVVINDTKAGVLYHTPNYGLRSVQLIEKGFEVETVPTDKISTSRVSPKKRSLYSRYRFKTSPHFQQRN